MEHLEIAVNGQLLSLMNIFLVSHVNVAQNIPCRQQPDACQPQLPN